MFPSFRHRCHHLHQCLFDVKLYLLLLLPAITERHLLAHLCLSAFLYHHPSGLFFHAASCTQCRHMQHVHKHRHKQKKYTQINKSQCPDIYSAFLFFFVFLTLSLSLSHLTVSSPLYGPLISCSSARSLQAHLPDKRQMVSTQLHSVANQGLCINVHALVYYILLLLLPPPSLSHSINESLP